MQFKRGDSFDFSGPVSATFNGAAVTDFTGWTARSEIRTPQGTLIASLTCTWLDAAEGLLRVYFPNLTTGWDLGPAVMDVEFTDPNGIIASTETQTFSVVRGVTE